MALAFLGLSRVLVTGRSGGFGKKLHHCSSWVVWEIPKENHLFVLTCQETELYLETLTVGLCLELTWTLELR